MGLFSGPKPEPLENWVCVFERGTEYEVAMARNWLANLKIPSNILSKRDSSYSLNIGDTSMVYLYVPKEFEARARKALQTMEMDPDVSDDEEYPDDGEDDRE
ncbi:MAG: hypothetical protein ACQER4_07655 [Bacteroidota bacterium]